MVSPFDRNKLNPFNNEPTELNTRYSLFSTELQRRKMERENQQRIARNNRRSLSFTPVNQDLMDTSFLPDGAETEAIIAQANSANPGASNHEKNWFMKGLQKWDDWTATFAGSDINPFNKSWILGSKTARELELNKKRYKRELKASGKNDFQAAVEANRLAWRETEMHGAARFTVEMISDPTNFLFWGAGFGIKAGVKTLATKGRKILSTADEAGKFTGLGSSKYGNKMNSMVSEDELFSNPAFYWNKQSQKDISDMFFRKATDKPGDIPLTFKERNKAKRKFLEFLKNPEEVTENTIKELYEDIDISKALHKIKGGSISQASYSRKMSLDRFTEMYKAPLLKSQKKYLPNSKSDYQYLRLHGTANSASEITNMKAAGVYIANTSSKIMAPLRWVWRYTDPAPFQTKTKYGRALLVAGARESDNKVLVASAVRKYTEEFKKLGLDGTNIGNRDLDQFIKKGFNWDDWAARTGTKNPNPEVLRNWTDFFENVLEYNSKTKKWDLAEWANLTKNQETSVRNIIDAWGDHGLHLVENGIISPSDFNLKVIRGADGQLVYNVNKEEMAQKYIGIMADAIGDKELAIKKVNFTKASGERHSKFQSGFKIYDDDFWKLTREDAIKQGINYSNDAIKTFDLKSGEVMDRLNHASFINKMKSIGDKRFTTDVDYIDFKKRINDIEGTFSGLKKLINNLPSGAGLGKTKYAAGVTNEFGKELKELINDVSPEISSEIKDQLDNMLVAIDEPMNQRVLKLEAAQKSLNSINAKIKYENDLVDNLRTMLNSRTTPLPPKEMEKSIRQTIAYHLRDAGHAIMYADGFFEPEVYYKLKQANFVDDYGRKIDIFEKAGFKGGVVGKRKPGTYENVPVPKEKGGRGLDPVTGEFMGYIHFDIDAVGTQARKIQMPKNITELRSTRNKMKELTRLLSEAGYSDDVVQSVNSTRIKMNEIIKKIDSKQAQFDEFNRDPIKGLESAFNDIMNINGIGKNPITLRRSDNAELFEDLHKLVAGYTKRKGDPNQKLNVNIGNDVRIALNERSLNKVDEKIKDIAQKTELSERFNEVLSLTITNPIQAKKVFGKHFTKKGTFRHKAWKDIDTHFPQVAALLDDFVGQGADPRFIDDYDKGLDDLTNILDEVKETLSDNVNTIQESVNNFRNRDLGNLVDPNVIKQSDRLKEVELVNINLRNGIPTKELENYFFEGSTAKEIEKFFGKYRPGTFEKLSESAGKVGDTVRMLKTGYDFGAPFIQGLPLLLTNPLRWKTATEMHYKTFFQGREAVASYMANKSHIIDEMIENGVDISGEGLDYYTAFKNDPEGFFNKVIGSGDAALGKVPGLKKISEEPLKNITKRFNEAFDTFGDIARIEMYEALRGTALKKASSGADEGLAMMQLADMVNKMTGAFSSRARGATRTSAALDRTWAFFSPRYTRASMSLVTDALMGGGSGIAGYAARRQLTQMLGSGMASYVGIVQAKRMVEEADGVPEEDRTKFYLDPRSVAEGGDGGKFMKIKLGDEGRESYVGFGGFFISFLKLTTQIASDPAFRGDKTDSPLLFTSDEDRKPIAKFLRNPLVQWLRGRQPPTSGFAWDMMLGHDFIGNPLETPTDWGKHVGKAVTPFWIEHGFMTGDNGLGLDRPAGLFAELSGFQANEISDWEELMDLKDEYSQKHHGLNWNDLPNLQQEELKLALAGTTDDIAAIEAEIFEVRKKYPMGTEVQELMPEWHIQKDNIQSQFDIQAAGLDSALNNNEIDVAVYINNMNYINKERRQRFKDLKNDPAYEAVYKNFDAQVIEEPTGVADYFYSEYIGLVTDQSGDFSLLPDSIKDLGITDTDFVDWDKKAEAINAFEQKVGPQVMEYIQARLNVKARVGDTPHPVYEEYVRGRQKYLEQYYEGVEKHALAIRGMENADEWNNYKRASYTVRKEIEKTNPIVKSILKDIRKARQILRKNDPELDAFLYRFAIGGTSTVQHSFNKSKHRKAELSQPYPMERYIPGFTID